MLLAAALLLALSAAVGLHARGHHAAYDPQSAAVPEGGGEGGGDETGIVRRRENWFYAQRAFPNRFTPPGALKREVAQARALRAASRAAASDSPALAVPALAWTSIGPAPISSIPTSSDNDGRTFGGVAPLSGRITAIANHPTSADTAYVGGAYGGVWKTIDGGLNWTATSDSLPSLAIGAISFPMLLDKPVGLATAVETSVRAVMANPIPLAAWGIFVALSLLVSALPLLVGLAVMVPVLGHATWHLYRKIVSV